MRVLISIDGEEYPCAPTMGAALRFKEESGKEVDEINPRSLSELCIYLYCCVASACDREGKPFGMSLMEFADRVTMEDVAGWQEQISDTGSSSGDDQGEKKSPPAS